MHDPGVVEFGLIEEWILGALAGSPASAKYHSVHQQSAEKSFRPCLRGDANEAAQGVAR
jgi:hypothetical protein